MVCNGLFNLGVCKGEFYPSTRIAHCSDQFNQQQSRFNYGRSWHCIGNCLCYDVLGVGWIRILGRIGRFVFYIGKSEQTKLTPSSYNKKSQSIESPQKL